MTLSRAKTRANQAFSQARQDIADGVSNYIVSRSLLNLFWGLRRDLIEADKARFQPWFEKRHGQLGSIVVNKK